MARLSYGTLRGLLRFGAGQRPPTSHGAAGVSGLPIPVRFPDANERIGRFHNGLSSAGDGGQ